MPQPEPLRRGNRFHRQVQEDWKRTAGGDIYIEKTVPLLRRPFKRAVRRGRMDIFVGEFDGMVAVVEIKATDWDCIKHVQRVLSNHERQVWKYVEKHLDVDKLSVCPGIIYPSPPSTPGLRETVEAYLNDRGLQVVWYTES